MGKIEELFCQGCGVAIQTENKQEPGYVPNSALENEVIICQRCFRLKNYNEVQDVPYTDGDFLQMVSQIANTKSLIVKMVDIFDFNGSFIRGLHRLTGNNKVIIIGNKVDLLPKSTNLSRVRQWIKKEAADLGVTVQDVYLISAKTGQGFDEVKQAIEYHREGQDVYVVGSTNVGKSTFINYLINDSVGTKDAITTSYFPGTTLGFIDIPLDDHSSLYDTPGVVNRGQLVHYLAKEDIKLITPNKEIKPRTYQLNSQQTLFIGGLARFDFIKGERQSFTCYFPNRVELHRTKLEKADQLYLDHLGTMLTPPRENTAKDYPKLVEQTIKLSGEKVDLVFPGLGWISLSGEPATVAVHSPFDVPVSRRNSII